MYMPEWTGKPVRMTPKAGETVAYCMCGLSKDGPVCDGAHKGTGIAPKVVTYEKDEQVSACGCKRTHTPPMCDDTHKTPE